MNINDELQTERRTITMAELAAFRRERMAGLEAARVAEIRLAAGVEEMMTQIGVLVEQGPLADHHRRWRDSLIDLRAAFAADSPSRIAEATKSLDSFATDERELANAK